MMSLCGNVASRYDFVEMGRPGQVRTWVSSKVPIILTVNVFSFCAASLWRTASVPSTTRSKVFSKQIRKKVLF